LERERANLSAAIDSPLPLGERDRVRGEARELRFLEEREMR